MFKAGLTDQFFLDVLNGVHQPGDDYRIALFNQAAAPDKNPSLVSYNSTGELPDAGGYSRGGMSLSGFMSGLLPSGGAFIDWTTDPIWKNASFTADAAVIYNASRAGKALAVISFGLTMATNGLFTIELPAPVISLTRKSSGAQ